MKHLLQIIFLIAGMGFFASCNKDDDTPPPPPTRTELLSNKSWITTALTVNPPLQLNNGNFVSDVYGFYQANQLQCILDDVKFFYEKGSYTFEEGATKCNPSDPAVWESGTWLFNSTESTLVTTHVVPQGLSSTTSYDILELNETTLQLRYIQRFRDPETEQVFAYTYTETHTIAAE
ncbi:hypothetical protein BH23BAC1_BH23BAC1_13190 [soil metagenome]